MVCQRCYGVLDSWDAIQVGVCSTCAKADGVLDALSTPDHAPWSATTFWDRAGFCLFPVAVVAAMVCHWLWGR